MGKKQIFPVQSFYQSKDVPLPIFTSDDPSATTFMGRLAKELVTMTDPKTSVFVPSSNSWHELKNHSPIITNDTFSLMEKALDITGMTALDKLLSFMVADQLKVNYHS